MRHFRARLVRHGPYVPVKCWFGAPLVDGETLDRSPRWQVVIGDATTALAAVQFAVDGIPVEIDGGPILRSCEPITKANYDFMVAHQAWAADHAPDHPKASPRRAVDFHAIRPPF